MYDLVIAHAPRMAIAHRRVGRGSPTARSRRGRTTPSSSRPRTTRTITTMIAPMSVSLLVLFGFSEEE